ncbi:MAG: hypothetical protein V4565_07995 [Bacteroidota bacterium]
MKYPKPNISIHSSFNEAAESHEKYIVNQNPIDRIKETVQLILRIYSISPKKPNTNLIYIDKE